MLIYEGRVQIAQHMRKMVEEKRAASFFLRDAANLEESDALVLIGTRIKPMRLTSCGLCGLGTCENKERYEHGPLCIQYRGSGDRYRLCRLTGS